MYDHIGLTSRQPRRRRALLYRGAGAARLRAVLAATIMARASGQRASPRSGSSAQGAEEQRRPCRVPRPGPCRHQEISCRGAEGRRPRQWRRPATGTITARPITRRSCSTPTATMSRRCARKAFTAVIARSASDEAILLPASPGLLRFARNDEVHFVRRD